MVTLAGNRYSIFSVHTDTTAYNFINHQSGKKPTKPIPTIADAGKCNEVVSLIVSIMIHCFYCNYMGIIRGKSFTFHDFIDNHKNKLFTMACQSLNVLLQIDKFFVQLQKFFTSNVFPHCHGI